MKMTAGRQDVSTITDLAADLGIPPVEAVALLRQLCREQPGITITEPSWLASGPGIPLPEGGTADNVHLTEGAIRHIRGMHADGAEGDLTRIDLTGYDSDRDYAPELTAVVLAAVVHADPRDVVIPLGAGRVGIRWLGVVALDPHGGWWYQPSMGAGRLNDYACTSAGVAVARMRYIARHRKHPATGETEDAKD